MGFLKKTGWIFLGRFFLQQLWFLELPLVYDKDEKAKTSRVNRKRCFVQSPKWGTSTKVDDGLRPKAATRRPEEASRERPVAPRRLSRLRPTATTAGRRPTTGPSRRRRRRPACPLRYTTATLPPTSNKQRCRRLIHRRDEVGRCWTRYVLLLF